jgi:hypothetical protein
MITLCFSKPLTEKLQTLLGVAYQTNDLRLYRMGAALLKRRYSAIQSMS